KSARLLARTVTDGNVLRRPVLIGRGLGSRCSRSLSSSSEVLASEWLAHRHRFGGHSGGETPGPIPNPEVKPSSADGTALETGWESRSPPRHLEHGAPPGAPCLLSGNVHWSCPENRIRDSRVAPGAPGRLPERIT